jgi:tRNA(Ile)-lysidine synthase
MVNVERNMQRIERGWRMFQVVRDTIEKFKLLTHGDRVVVAVSGGPDSVALTHVLFLLKDDYNLALHIAHLNHMFRGEEAEGDARFVAQLAGSLGLDWTVSKVDVPAFASEKRMSAQAAARQVRYSFLEQVRSEWQGTKIATGHQADDQTETVLLNILRGAGPEGLSGIPPKRDDIYIRPLINVTRDEVEAYCRDNSLSYRQDLSNIKPVYLRNKVRLELLPILKNAYNPGISASLLRLSHIMRDENDFMQTRIQEYWDGLVISDNGSEVIFNLPDFLQAHAAIRRRLLRKAWAALRDGERDLEFVHLEQAMDFLRDGTAGGVIELPLHILLEKSYDTFSLKAAGGLPGPSSFCHLLKVPGSTVVPELGVSIDAGITETWPGNTAGKVEAWFDFDKITGPLTVRSRRPGDRFWPLNGNGSKKLKEFFIDEKIPRNQRDRVPIITVGEEILWVGGIRPDNRWRVSDHTNRFLHLKIRKILQK